MNGRIYFISGLGADRRLFSRQIASGLPITVIPWKIPFKNESLESYVQRMSEEITLDSDNLILGGVSFGGMIAVEMAKILNPKKVIIISSIKSKKELPFHIRIWKYFPVYRLMSGKLIKNLGYLARIIFGKMNREESAIFLNMVKDADPSFIKWAIHVIVNWSNEEYPSSTVHIHGARDRIFPYTNLIQPILPVQSGSHIMIMTEATTINPILNKECRDS